MEKIIIKASELVELDLKAIENKFNPANERLKQKYGQNIKDLWRGKLIIPKPEPELEQKPKQIEGDYISEWYIKVLKHFNTNENVDLASVIKLDGKTEYPYSMTENDKNKLKQVLQETLSEVEAEDKYKEYYKELGTSNGNLSIRVKCNTRYKVYMLKKCFENLRLNNKDISSYILEFCEKERAVLDTGVNDKDIIDIGALVNHSIEENKQVIFTGAPGTGKTFSVREYVKNSCMLPESEDGDEESSVDTSQYKFVQFHPSYDYTDFVEGLRPVVFENSDQISFVRVDGIFKEFCRHIVKENQTDKKFYFIVDEINRADLSKVFGELMFGLEESYRGERNRILTQYRNLPTYEIVNGKARKIEEDVFKDGFYIPENLYFIGTMNDIDRSVDSMDFALRRRFTWIEIKANDIMETSLFNIFALKNEKLDTDDLNELVKKWSERIKKMNNVISSNFGLTDAYHIGPAYFKINLSKAEKNNADEFVEDSIKKIFDNNITSILREYTRGRNNQDVEDFIKECRKELFPENSSGESNA